MTQNDKTKLSTTIISALRSDTLENVSFELTEEQINLLKIGCEDTIYFGEEKKTTSYNAWAFVRESGYPQNFFKIKKFTHREINNLIEINKPQTNRISDGFHSFGELYEFRKVYNAALFNEWAAEHMKNQEDLAKGWSLFHNPPTKYKVHKSWKHFDGEPAFGGGWFIVSALLPSGQISNHYEAKDWDLFKIPETEKALFEFDNHTAQDVLKRLKQL